MDETCQFPIVSKEEHFEMHLSQPFRSAHAIHLYDSGYTARDGRHVFLFKWACACWGSADLGGKLSEDRAVSLKHAIRLAEQHLKRYGAGR